METHPARKDGIASRPRPTIARLIFLLLLVLGASHPSWADGVFTERFLATRDGVPVQILATPTNFSIIAMTYDPQDRILYIVEDGFGTGGAVTLNVDTGETIRNLGFFDTNLPAGLAFDSVQRCLYYLSRGTFCKLDLAFNPLACTPLEFPVTDFAGLAYDPGLDAFWAHISHPFLHLLDSKAEVLQVIDLSAVLDLPNFESVRGVAFDQDEETILLQTWPRYLLTVSRSGDLLSRVPLPLFESSDEGLAWFPDALPESHLAARAGFLGRGGFPITYELHSPVPALFVNGSIGDTRREVIVPVGAPLEISIDIAGAVPDFALFAFPGEARPEDLSRFNVPFSRNTFGVPVFPMPFTDGDASRTILVTNATGRPAFGEGLFQTGPAPVSILLPEGVSRPRTVTLQALYTAAGIRSGRLGNAIVLRVE